MLKRLTIDSIDSTSSIGTGGRCAVLQREQPAQGHQVLGLVVDELRVLAEDVVAARARGVLQPEHGVGVEQVRRAVAAPLVLAAGLQALVRERGAVLRVRGRVPRGVLGRDDVDADAAELGSWCR